MNVEKLPYVEQWKRWFAWYPVRVENKLIWSVSQAKNKEKLVWLRYVERMDVRSRYDHTPYWVYRKPMV